MAQSWSKQEATDTVKDYFSMLFAEVRGEPYNKAAHRRQLLEKLNGRSNGAVERKHQNISAILFELGLPYIDGYKPLANYQALLREVVEDFLTENLNIVENLLSEGKQQIAVHIGQDLSYVLVDPPESSASTGITHSRLKYRPQKYNFVEREANNTHLGREGERFALKFERTRLVDENRSELARKIEWISETQGDGAGYDIRSFESSGEDRYIEVKTTRFNRGFPFFVSDNELRFSRENAPQYYLYRVFHFPVSPQLFILQGELDKHCQLEPKTYRATV